MIASNIANADTPFYRPRDVRFEDLLAAKKAEALGHKSAQLAMAQTNEAHIKPKTTQAASRQPPFFATGTVRATTEIASILMWKQPR